MIADVWNGLAVFRSDDCLHWTRQAANLLQEAGTVATDRAKGCDVVVSGSRAWIFYFTHQGGADAEGREPGRQKHTVIQVAELEEKDGVLGCDRNQATRIDLKAE
jgi:hypothetical protein